jgi:glycosyl transferase family 87
MAVTRGWPITDRTARVALAGVIAVLMALAARARVTEFWADGAVYYTMALSLAEDGDLRYEARDALRVRRDVPSGAQGIFLKRTDGGWTLGRASGFPYVHRFRWNRPEERPIYFAKAFLYPLVAAPLVKLTGPRGLFLLNAASLGVALLFGYSELRRRTTPGRALAGALVLFLATVTPVYLFWPQPEMLNLGLVAASLWAWRRERPLLAAVLLGAVAYSKPYNVLLALPLGLEPLLMGGRPWPRRLLEATRRALVTAATTLFFFGLNAAVTGEMNYQGGERKTFYGVLPFEAHGVTFGNSGQWMRTDTLGPLVQGEDKEPQPRGTAPARPRAEIRASFLRNLGYFWIGRFGGALPYYAPAVLALLVFLAVGPRTLAGWLAVVTLVISWLFYITQIPDNWYGGGGTVGNRYFLNLLPLAVLFWPPGREGLVAGVGGAASAALLLPIWAAPVFHSLRPGDHSMHGAFRLLPAELTMLNDLGVCAEPWRKKRPYGDTEGDPRRPGSADPRAYFLYFMDDGTYGKDSLDGTEGFWLHGGTSGEVVLRSLEPVRRMTLRVTGGPAGDEVTLRQGGQERTLSVGPGASAEAALEPGPGFAFNETVVYVLRFRSRRGAPAPGRPERPLGAFVRISLEVGKPPP